MIVSQRIGPTTGIRSADVVLGGQPSGPPGSGFTEKFIKIKLPIGLKVTAWIRFWTSMDIREKLGAVPSAPPGICFRE